MIDTRRGWTRTSLMSEGIKNLKAVNIGDAGRNVEWILCELLDCNRASLYAYPELAVPEDICADFVSLLNRRMAHEPLQHILGYTEFCGIRFSVTPDVLIPRPETELLVEHATDFLRKQSTPAVLDIGSGSGCIPVSIKHFNPQALVSSCDVSPPALLIAEANAKAAGTAVSFFQCDILKEELPLPNEQTFDLIVSNPPYIPITEYQVLDPEVLAFEPELALNTGEDPMLFYRAIGHVAKRRLKPSGIIIFETHCDYAHEVATLLTNQGFSAAQVLKDLTGRDRFVKATSL
ncbi:MAG: peptide chain release factor N(5)-glutamine methyltransferase [Rhodothermales bacterium]